MFACIKDISFLVVSDLCVKKQASRTTTCNSCITYALIMDELGPCRCDMNVHCNGAQHTTISAVLNFSLASAAKGSVKTSMSHPSARPPMWWKIAGRLALSVLLSSFSQSVVSVSALPLLAFTSRASLVASSSANSWLKMMESMQRSHGVRGLNFCLGCNHNSPFTNEQQCTTNL